MEPALSIELGLCRGLCVDTKLALTSKGLSACVGAGVGEGNTLDLNPFGELDKTRDAFVKGQAGLGLGPITVSAEVEADSLDCSPTVKPKACVAFLCLGDALDPKEENVTSDYNAVEQIGDGLTKLGGDTPQKKGPKVTASVLLFTCQALEF